MRWMELVFVVWDVAAVFFVLGMGVTLAYWWSRNIWGR